MKRKQKVPRRTRPTSNSGVCEESLVDYSSPQSIVCHEEKTLEIPKKRAATSVNLQKPVKELLDNCTKCEDRSFQSLDHLTRCLDVREALSYSNDHRESLRRIESLEQPSTASQTLRLLQRNLKEPEFQVQEFKHVLNSSDDIANSRQTQKGDCMPVIVNVFSLSQASEYSDKMLSATKKQENSCLATPPCSPPLLQFGSLCSGAEVYQDPLCHKEMRTSIGFPSVCSLINTPLNAPPHKRHVPYVDTSFQPIPPSEKNVVIGQNNRLALNNSSYQRNFTYLNQRRNDLFQFASHHNYAKGIQESQFSQPNASIMRNTEIVSRENFAAPQGLDFARSNLSRVSNQTETHQLVFSESLQSVETNLQSRNMSSNVKKNEEITGDLVDLNTSGYSSNERYNEYESRQIRQAEVAPHVSTATKASYITAQPTAQKASSSLSCADSFLSPRDIKVLQLKKRLQEQEAMLNKLRTNR